MWVYVNGIGIDIRIFADDEIDRIIVESALQLAAKRRNSTRTDKGETK